MTRLKDMVAILICDDVQLSIRFYEDILGFTVVDRMDAVGRTGWASIRKDDVQLMLASPDYMPIPEKAEGRLSQAMFYFYPDDVEQLHAEISNKGMNPSKIETRLYGMKEFELIDPDGHVLVFGQEVEAQQM